MHASGFMCVDESSCHIVFNLDFDKGIGRLELSMTISVINIIISEETKLYKFFYLNLITMDLP